MPKKTPSTPTTVWLTRPLKRRVNWPPAQGWPVPSKPFDPPALLLFEPHQPELCGFYPNTFLDITPVFEKKRAAMEVMGAQGHLREYYSQRANHARRICGDNEIKFAEAFQRIAPTVLKGF
jgi:4-oxalomesaconate hydratase